MRAAAVALVALALLATTGAAQAAVYTPPSPPPWLPAPARAELRLALGITTGPVPLRTLHVRDETSPLLIGARAGVDLDALGRDLERATGSGVRVDAALGLLTVPPAGAATAIGAVRSDQRVAFIERATVVALAGEPMDDLNPLDISTTYAWWHQAVQAPAALAAVGGATNVPVGIVDTGVEAAHVDLAGRVRASYDGFTGGVSAGDSNGHGTFIAGLIAMIDGNGAGGRGIAGATPLLVAAAGTPEGISIAAAARGVQWAADQGAGVITLSFGGPVPSQTLERALAYATGKDVVLVASSGNSALEGNPPNHPAEAIAGLSGSVATGLSVGAMRPDGTRASFSSFGDHISVIAPGAGPVGLDCRGAVYSTVPAVAPDWDDAPPPCLFTPQPGGSRWGLAEGTSFAAPIVAGVAAVVRQARPQLRAPQVIDVIQRSARGATAGWNRETGWGLVDAAAAVALARAADLTPPQLTVEVVPSVHRLEVGAVAVDRAIAPEVAAAGLPHVTIEVSDDAASWRLLVEGDTAAGSTIPAPPGKGVHLRVRTCDSAGNCSEQQTDRIAGTKAAPKVRVALARRLRRGIVLRITTVDAGPARGRGSVRLAYWTGERWKTFDTVGVWIGKSKNVTYRVDPGRLRVRATLLPAEGWTKRVSPQLSLRVRPVS